MRFRRIRVIAVATAISSIVIPNGINSDNPMVGINSLAWASKPEGVHSINRSREEIKCIPNAVINVKNPAGIDFFSITPHIIRQESKKST